MKMLGGVSLLCLSVAWALFWCAEAAHPLLAHENGYLILFIFVASLAVIPLFWATSLLDHSIRAPLEPAAAPELFITPPLQNFQLESLKVKGEQEPAVIAPGSPPLLDSADAAAETGDIKSATPIAVA